MNFFKKNKKSEPKIKNFGIEIDKTSWFEVFSASLGRVMANQERCSQEVVKGQNWDVDLSAGTLAFGQDVYPVQFLGSESNASNTWLWGWDNINHFPESVVKLANEMKQIGEVWGLEALTLNQFKLTESLTGHTLAIVTCALSTNNICYYRGPYDGGAVLLGFWHIPQSVFEPIDHTTFTRIVMECIQGFQVDHKIFVESFLCENSTVYDWNGLSIKAYFDKTILIEFEEIEAFLRVKEIKTL